MWFSDSIWINLNDLIKSSSHWNFGSCEALKGALALQRHDPQAANNHLIWWLSKAFVDFDHCCGHWCHFNSQNVDFLLFCWFYSGFTVSVCLCCNLLQCPMRCGAAFGIVTAVVICSVCFLGRAEFGRSCCRGAFYSRWWRRLVGSFPSLLTIAYVTNWYKLQQNMHQIL